VELGLNLLDFKFHGG